MMGNIGGYNAHDLSILASLPWLEKLDPPPLASLGERGYFIPAKSSRLYSARSFSTFAFK
jgi:hypothetical protein